MPLRVDRAVVLAFVLGGCVGVADDEEIGALAEPVEGDAPYADLYSCDGRDHCAGRPGRACYGVPPLVTTSVDQFYSCESLRHDLSPFIDDAGNFICIVEANKAAEGCCGSLEAAEQALANGVNYTRSQLRPSLIDCLVDGNGNPLPNCPTPTEFCSGGSFEPFGPDLDLAANRGYLHVGPCSGEYKVAYLPQFLATDYSAGPRIDGELVVLPEPGRLMLGISGVGSGVMVVRMDGSSPLCTQYGWCSGSQLLGQVAANSTPVVDALKAITTSCYGSNQSHTLSGCPHLPFVHYIGKHGFGWYEVANLPAGTYAVVELSIGGTFLGYTFSGHATVDTYAYYGSGGNQRYPGCTANPTGVSGDVNASPATCSIASGGTTCATTLSWSTTGNLRMAALFLRETGQQVAAGLSSSDPAYGGGLPVDWITEQGYHFDLRACGQAPDMSDCATPGGALLDTVFVRGNPPPTCGATCDSAGSCNNTCTLDGPVKYCRSGQWMTTEQADAACTMCAGPLTCGGQSFWCRDTEASGGNGWWPQSCECTPGQSQSQGCGDGGSRTRTCDGHGSWGGWGGCTGCSCGSSATDYWTACGTWCPATYCEPGVSCAGSCGDWAYGGCDNHDCCGNYCGSCVDNVEWQQAHQAECADACYSYGQTYGLGWSWWDCWGWCGD